MNDPATADRPAAAPLDAEREVLRKLGHTEAEISQILVARTLAGSQQAGAAGQGVMSNVLSSIVAVASHARLLIPTFRKDVETVFDGTATASVRAGATASLAVKAIVVIVLGYAAWQEWKQHIIYSTEIAEQQARKMKADAARAEAESLAATGKVLPVPGYARPEQQQPIDPAYDATADRWGGTRYDAATGRCEWAEHLNGGEQRLKDLGFDAHCPQEEIDAANAAFLQRMRKDPVNQ